MAAAQPRKIYDRYTAIVGGVMAMFLPGIAARWMFGRSMVRAFQAGESRDADFNFRPRLTSGDANAKRAFQLAVGRCRDQAENNPLISGALDRIANNVVRGGIAPIFKFRKRDGKFDIKANRAWRQLFDRWSRYCEISGHDSLGSCQRLGLRHMWTDGGYLIHRLWDTSMRGVVPLRFELIELDQLDRTIDGMLNATTVARKGIEYDLRTGRELAFHILKQHPGDYLATAGLGESVRIPASDIIHVWDRRRISQYSGVPWLAAVVLEAYRMEDFRHITQDAARFQSVFFAFLKGAMPNFQLGAGLGFGGQAGPSGYNSGVTTESISGKTLVPNMVQPLPQGADIDFKAPTHPGNNYEPFVKDSQRSQSVGLGMSFEGFANNYTESSYASARSGSLEERLGYRGQQMFLEEKVNRRLVAWFIEAAFVAGLAPVNMPNYADDPAYYHEMADGQLPGWGWVDPANDASAAQMRIDLLIDTKHNLTAQTGQDWDEIMDIRLQEIERELELEQKRQELTALRNPAPPPQPAVEDNIDGNA